jgi:Bacterial Ig-like domain (group 2)
MRWNSPLSLIVSVVLAASLGCGGGSSSSVVAHVVAVSVSPGTVNLVPGQTKQFNAKVTGSSNMSVTWAVMGSGNGSIDQTGLYTAPATVSSQTDVTITATAAADTTKSANAKATLVALTGLRVQPRGPAVAVGGSQQLVATGTFGDGSTHDWTSQSAWSSANPRVAMVGGATGVVTGAGLGVTTITATGGSFNASTAVNVTNMAMGNGNLSGHYAFSISHAGIRGRGFEVGSFDADGAGNIIAGREDSNAAVGSTPATGLAITGSYSVYLDGRGLLTLTTANSSNTYTFVLSNDGPPSATGRLILSGAGGVEVGAFQAQNVSASLSGNYAFLLGGVDGKLQPGATTFQNPEALAGQFSASTGLVGGVVDVNDNGVINGAAGSSTALSFTATYSVAVDSNGRGTLVLTPPASLNTTQNWNFAYYVVSANKVLLIQTDLQSSPLSTPALPALAGTAEFQSPSTPSFSNTDVSGKSYVFLLELTAASGIFGDAGQWAFGSSPANALTGEMDINKLGNTINVTIANSGSSASYGTIAANGRGTVAIPSASTTPVTPSLNSAVFYLISSGKMYVLETDVKPNGGVAEQQTNTATLLTGTLSFGLAQLATNGFDSSFAGQLVNLSSLAGIADSNIGSNCNPGSSNCVLSQAGSALTGSFNPADLQGRGAATFQLNQFGTPSGTPPANAGFYLVTPTKMVVFGLSTIAGYQPVDGMIENQ